MKVEINTFLFVIHANVMIPNRKRVDTSYYLFALKSDHFKKKAFAHAKTATTSARQSQYLACSKRTLINVARGIIGVEAMYVIGSC